MHKQKVVIVGGGISGLFAANKLAAYDQFDITLIESSDRCGGLLNAYRSEQGVQYDQGTHLASKTGIAHIDKILFGEDKLAKHWHEFSYLNSGNYFSGQWNLKTQVVDIRSLPTECYHKCVGELLTSVSDTKTEDYSTFIRSHVGSYLSDKLFTPSVKKLYGDEVDFTHLKPKVGYFGLNRVVAFDDETSEVLKSIPKYDEKLAFSSSKYFAEKTNITESYLYPKSELGIQFWTDSLLNRAVNKGVKVKTSSQITHLNAQQANVTKVELKGGESLDCEYVIWTAPPFLALRLANIAFTSAYRPVLRTANLFHFSFNRPVLNSQNHYVWNWDESFKSFRITLYDNIAGRAEKGSRLTLEILSNEEQSELLCYEHALEELKELGLIDNRHIVIDQARQTIPNTFPVPTKQLDNAVKEVGELLRLSLKNVIFAGRHSSTAWLQTDVIKSIDKQIEEIFF